MKRLLQILLLTVVFASCQNHGAKQADLSSADSVLVDSLFKYYKLKFPTLSYQLFE